MLVGPSWVFPGKAALPKGKWGMVPSSCLTSRGSTVLGFEKMDVSRPSFIGRKWETRPNADDQRDSIILCIVAGCLMLTKSCRHFFTISRTTNSEIFCFSDVLCVGALAIYSYKGVPPPPWRFYYCHRRVWRGDPPYKISPKKLIKLHNVVFVPKKETSIKNRVYWFFQDEAKEKSVKSKKNEQNKQNIPNEITPTKCADNRMTS